eukprot:749354-Hanusia_phi.AAC.4
MFALSRHSLHYLSFVMILSCWVEPCHLRPNAAFASTGLAGLDAGLNSLRSMYTKQKSRCIHAFVMTSEGGSDDKAKFPKAEAKTKSYRINTALSENPLMKRAQAIMESKMKKNATSLTALGTRRRDDTIYQKFEDTEDDLPRMKPEGESKSSTQAELEEYRKKIKELPFTFSNPLLKEINQYIDLLEDHIGRFSAIVCVGMRKFTDTIVEGRREYDSVRFQADFDVNDRQCGGKAAQTQIGKIWKQKFPDDSLQGFLKTRRFHVDSTGRISFIWLKKAWLKQAGLSKTEDEPTAEDMELSYLKELERIALSDEPIYVSQLTFNEVPCVVFQPLELIVPAQEMRNLHRELDELE